MIGSSLRQAATPASCWSCARQRAPRNPRRNSNTAFSPLKIVRNGSSGCLATGRATYQPRSNGCVGSRFTRLASVISNKKVRWGVRALFMADPEKVLAELRAIVEDSVLCTITHQELVQQLGKRGYRLRNLTRREHARAAVENATDPHVGGARRRLIQRRLVPRAAAETLLSRVDGTTATDSVMTGRAGAGKTACVGRACRSPARERDAGAGVPARPRSVGIHYHGSWTGTRPGGVAGACARGGGRSSRAPRSSDRRSVGRREHHIRQELRSVRSRGGAAS